jgi:hypothetical protein
MGAQRGCREMRPPVRNRRLGMVSPRRGLGKQSRRIPSDGGQGLHMPFFNTLCTTDHGGLARCKFVRKWRRISGKVVA